MRTVLNFNKKWAFTKNADAVPATMPERWDWVNIPHSWNAIDGQDGDNDFYRGTCYYAKSLQKMNLPEADQYYLEINGANSSADVYVNGKHMAHHDGVHEACALVQNLLGSQRQGNVGNLFVKGPGGQIAFFEFC